jgi:hypothetical protein
MPRQARLDAPGTLHHVMIRGIEGANIFSDDKDREHFIARVGEIAKVRAKMACFLSREMGISMAEIARKLGVGASAIAMAIRRKNP